MAQHQYEEIYLRVYDSVSEARASIDRYLDFYNVRRTHLGGALCSLMIEMQFYLICPILALMLRQRGVRFYIILLSFMVLLRALLFALNGTIHRFAYFLIFGNLDLFLIGCLAGVFCQRAQHSLPHLLSPMAASCRERKGI